MTARQPAMRLSGRSREPGSKVRRARRADVQASAEHDGLEEGGLAREEVGESIGRSELSPFLRQMESPSSPPGEGLTARDILEAHRMFEEGGGGFEVGEEAEAGPLGDAELGFDQHIDRQVM